MLLTIMTTRKPATDLAASCNKHPTTLPLAQLRRGRYTVDASSRSSPMSTGSAEHGSLGQAPAVPCRPAERALAEH